jgi:AcrR family transcriptional regulator
MKKASAPKRAPWTQRRGEERRQRLIEAAAALLADLELNEISLEDVARRAQIPTASAYHFYKDKHALLIALAAAYGEEFARLLRRPLPAAKINCWEDVLNLQITRAVRFYAANPAARKLLIDGKVPADIKLADRVHDREIGAILEATVAAHFELAQTAEQTAVFYHGVEIVDLMLQLSMIHSRRITAEMVRHARIASIAYVREFLPATLPRKVRHEPAEARKEPVR